MRGFLSMRKQAPRKSVARVTSGRIECKAIPFVSSCQFVFYFNRLGFRQTSSGGMTFSPIRSIAFLSNVCKAFFMGVMP